LALENWREVINAKPLEIASFHLCHIFLRLGKLAHLPNQLCKTVEDALRAYINEMLIHFAKGHEGKALLEHALSMMHMARHD